MKGALLRVVLRFLTHTFYRLKIVGQENIPKTGPALFVSNHLSYGDPVLISACVPRPIRFLAWRELHDDPRFAWFFNATRSIPIAPTDTRRQLVTSLNEARHALEQGEQVALFAEGEISRIAQLLGFRKGLETISRGMSIPIIPVNLDGLWGSMFSYERGRFFRKLPRHIPYHVTVSFGAPMPSTTPAHEVRQSVMDMGARAFAERMKNAPTLHRSFLKRARKHWNAPCVDGWTAGQMAVSAFLIARIWRRQIPGSSPVGVRIELSPLFALVNLALAWAGKTVVLLDPALSDDELAKRRAAANVATVVTEIPKIGVLGKIFATFALRFFPTAVTTKTHNPLAAIIFGPDKISFNTSEIQSNITALQEVFALGSADKMNANVALSDPLTLIQALWWPLLAGAPVHYEKNGGAKGSITVEKEGATRFVLNHDNAYVSTEMGGAVCVNTADVRYGKNEFQAGTKPGSMGRPLPGVTVRVVDTQTGQQLAPGQPGALQIKRFSDEWIPTGECAAIDIDGFVDRCNLSNPGGVPIDGRSNKENL